MTTEDFIIELSCRIDDLMTDATCHSQAGLYPSELVTLGDLFALKGVGGRPFYRWLSCDYGYWFPRLSERTCLFRQLKTQRQWTYRFLVKPSLLDVIDSYGNKLIHMVRRERNPSSFGTAGISNHRWIMGPSGAWLLIILGRLPAGYGRLPMRMTRGFNRWLKCFRIERFCWLMPVFMPQQTPHLTSKSVGAANGMIEC